MNKKQEELFANFQFNNEELPERDAEILREIEEHRQTVRN